ncbi:MFS transporter [Nocardia huaxiensis]|uniref:MFS transporter n=1 Tax=Nocardia huaxiensis TaxID=2755382 RepID=A0A7D6ZGJ0_9NOCA|nr:MFS transporter [Nocardia huaxiensis]QLY30339.1 MFS transporter [Nocardia huaxiensis]
MAHAGRTAAAEPMTARQITVLAICCTAVLMAYLDTTAINVALPAIGRDLHASLSGAQWTVAAYTVVMACSLTLAGSLGDRFGRRTVLQTGLVLFAAGSLACSLAPSLGWLVAFRMVQAIGGATLSPVAMSILSATFPNPAQRVQAIGLWSGTMGISMAAGPVVGGFLVDAIGWEAVFWMNAPIAAVTLVLTALFVPQSRAARARDLDPVGQVLVIGFLGALVFAIIEGPHRGWDSAVTLGCLGCSLVCLTALIAYESRRAEPLIDVRAFRSPALRGATAIAVCAYAAMGGFLFLNTFFLQEVRGDRPFRAGLELLPMAAAMFVFSPLSGRIVTCWGARTALVAGAATAAVASAVLAYTFDGGGQLVLLAGYALFGAGIGLVNPPITDAAVSGLPPDQAGVASSLASTSRQIGQSLGVAVIGSILAAHHGALDSAAAFHTPALLSWLTIAGVSLIALVIAVMTGRSATARR